MVGLLAAGAAGGALLIAYASGIGTWVLTSRKNKPTLVTAGVIPDFFDQNVKNAFTKSVRDLTTHLSLREEMYPWQRLWNKDDETPYLTLAAQINLLQMWLMGHSPHVRSEATYHRAKKVAIELICPKSGLEEPLRLIDHMTEGTLPQSCFNSDLCSRISRFQPQIAQRIKALLLMEGPNRSAYDIVPSLERNLPEVFKKVDSALKMQTHQLAKWRWIWWFYKPSQSANADKNLSQLAHITSRAWAQITFPPRGTDDSERALEFTDQALRVAEIGRQILQKAEVPGFKKFFKESYHKITFALKPIRAGLKGSIKSPLKSMQNFDLSQAHSALEENRHFMRLIEQMFNF